MATLPVAPEAESTYKRVHVTESVRARAKYVATFMQTGDKKAAMTASGLGKRAHDSITAMLVENCDLYDRPRSGRPPKYTDEVMHRAYQILVEEAEELLTGTELLARLVAAGVVDSPADPDTFLRHLHQYVRSLGHILIVNSTRTTFFLTANDVVERVCFASRLHGLLTGPNPEWHLDMAIFIDESTLEEDPHPKGRNVA